MSMPNIPGLSGAPAQSTSLADMVGALTDDELEELQQKADAAKAAGLLDEYLGAGGEGDGPGADAAESEHEPPSSSPGHDVPEAPSSNPENEVPDADDAEGDEEEPEEEFDPGPLKDEAKAAKKAGKNALSELEDLVDEAGDHEAAGIDAGALKKHLDDAEGHEEDLDKALDELDDAIDSEDQAAAQQACQDVKDHAAAIQQCLDEAKQEVGEQAGEAIPDGMRAMDAWSQKVLGGPAGDE